MESLELYFAITAPGLEHVAGKELLHVLKVLGEDKSAKIQAHVETNFLSGQIHFCCSSLISPIDIICRIQTVERICASVCSVTNISLEAEAGLNDFRHLGYHWDDDRFDRACNLWAKTISIRSRYDNLGNKELKPADQEYDFRPKGKRCSCPRAEPSPGSAVPFRINQLITQKCNHNNTQKLEQNTELTKNLSDSVGTANPNLPDPPSLLPLQEMKLSGQFPVPSELLKQKLDKYRDNSELDLSVEERTGFVPSFRVTCSREGPTKHEYTSMEIARYVGGTVFERYEWAVNLEKFDIHIWGHMFHNNLLLGILLTPDPSVLHRKSRVVFGKTTLKPSIAACIGLFAEIKPHEIVLDPMCGTGTIPTEMAARVPGCFAIGGDYCEEAIEQCKENIPYSHTLEAIKHRTFSIEENEEKFKKTLHCIHPVNIIHWNVKNIPLRDNCIDVVVCDMPFGRRSGSYSSNSVLYPKFMNEITRVVRPGGRIILLTLQKKLLIRVLATYDAISVKEIIPCFMGGLPLDLYYLEYNPKE